MDCNHACHMLQRLLGILRQLVIVYGYLIQTAPTEEARRLMELNLMTVRNTIAKVDDLMKAMIEYMTPTGEVLEETPVFETFVAAARFAFIKETQAIAMVNNLIMLMDPRYCPPLQGIIVDHQLNAMRILYILT